MKNFVTRRFTLNSSLPLFIICTLVLLIVFVAVFRMSNLAPYSVPKQLDIKAEKEILLKIGEDGETLIIDADGATVTNTNKIPTNIPAEGDALTITDSNNSNHTKTYLVTYVETYYVYHSTRPVSERTLRVGIHPPLTKTVSDNADVVFSPVLFKVIKPNAVSTYSLGTDNLFKFKLQLEEYL